MTFLDLVTNTTYLAQPFKPTQGKRCSRGDGDVSVGWAWTGQAWQPACPAHMPIHPQSRIYNSEYQED